jgi:putative peptidoglycan lipid II flippase
MTSPPPSLHKKVGIASAIMMSSVLASRLVGILRESVIAGIGGASGEVDAYQVAFVVPEILNHIVASGFLSVTFIPIFTAYLVRHQEKEGWRIFSVIYTCFGCLLVILCLICFIFAPQLIDLAAHGRTDPEFKRLAVRMTRIIIPAQFFFFSGGLFMAVQFAKEKFSVPAVAPVVYNLGIIAGGTMLGPWLGMEGFSWGVLAGAFVGSFAVQLWAAKKVGLHFRITFDFHHPDLKKYVLLTLPLMVGLTMMFSMEIFMRFFGSFLPPGNIAALNYGKTIFLVPVGLFGQAVGAASFPFLARLCADDNILEMNRLMNSTLRYLALVIPFSVLLMVLRHEIVLILFQRGRFDATATALTGQVLFFLLPGAFALSAYTIVVRGFHAMQNTLFPAIFGTAAVLLSLPFYWYGMKLLGAGGIALAVTLSVILQVVVLYMIWNKRSGNSESHRVYQFYGKIILISLPIGLVLAQIKAMLFPDDWATTFWGSVMACTIVSGVFLLLLLVAGRLLGIREIADLGCRLTRRL